MSIDSTYVTPTAHTFVGQTSQARVPQREAARVLAKVRGMTAVAAVQALGFSAGTICPEVSRVVLQALAAAEREHGPEPAQLRIVASEVGPGELVTRVRRLAHGRADWITTQTTAIRVELGTDPFEMRSDER